MGGFGSFGGGSAGGYGGRSSGRGRGRNGGGRRGFSSSDWLMLVASLVVAAGVALSWSARWINPAGYGFMSAAGLLMPVLFAANFLCLLYWVIRWRIGAVVPLAVLVLVVWNVTLFWRPALAQQHGAPSRSLVTVASYNVRGMMRPVDGYGVTGGSGSGRDRVRSSMREVVTVVDSLKADILCIQEFQSTPDHSTGRFEEALPAYHYKRVRYVIEGGQGVEGNYGWGNAIYSKYPISDSGHIDFEGTNNSILWADVAVRRDTVRVFCAHLQTTAIKASDEQYIVEGGFVADSTRTSRVKNMLRRLEENYIIRAAQAETLASEVAASPHPVIVCGDFNDTPASWAYRNIARGLKDSFREAGRGYGYTYRGFFNLLRIDYILHSPELECEWYLSPSFDNSDHNPVVTKLKVG
jgi:endonuclease/exonuclease/phosphatase family metal-dependent hydrolase